ncbi:MAG: MBL fold metallo-hydrolase [Candidatus Fermentibacteraceae bacterium]
MLAALLLAAGPAAPEGFVARVTVAYDNVMWHDSAGSPAAPGLRNDWGFSALVETDSATVLFDTGTHGGILLSNMEALGLDPASVDAVVLSHGHSDHCGGLGALTGLPDPPAVFVLEEFAETAPESIRHVVFGPDTVTRGVLTTGPVEGPLTEQALVVPTGSGPLVVCGCSHPGAHRMARAAAEVCGEPPRLVMGGFHMGGATPADAEALADSLEKLGTRTVAPTHCTGETAREVLRARFGEGFREGGLGWRLVVR